MGYGATRLGLLTRAARGTGLLAVLDVITAVAMHEAVGLVSALTVAHRNKRTSTADHPCPPMRQR